MIDDIIAKKNSKGLVTDKAPRTENGITKTAHIFLPYIVNIDICGLPHEIQQVLFALSFELILKRRSRVKVILDGTLAVSANDKDIFNAALQRLFHNILDGWLVHNGQHLLRRCLGCGKKSCPISCCRNDSLSYALLFHLMYAPSIM